MNGTAMKKCVLYIGKVGEMRWYGVNVSIESIQEERREGGWVVVRYLCTYGHP